MRSAPQRRRNRRSSTRLAVAILGALALVAGCGTRQRPRVLVIGLDGATFGVLDSLLAEGVLPNLAALRNRGTEAVLESVLPPVSPPAWTSATTGVNPGKHNVYDFFHMSKTSPQALLTSALDRRARPVWHFLNEKGFRTGIMNIPMTFPPDRVDGFFISGFPFGSATTGYTYPAELEKQLGDYPLDLFGESLPAGREGLLLEHYRRTLARQAEVAEQLIEEKDWDLFWVVFTGTDKVQHFFWKYADPQNPGYTAAGAAEFGDAIRDIVIRVDKVIGELVARAGPETDVIVLSDHGFGPIRHELRLTNWLRDEGFIVADSSGAVTKFQAFPPGPFSGLLRVAESGRDYGGQVPRGEASKQVRDELAARLTTLVEPETGLPFVEKVYRREEVYHGPYLENAPDLVFVEAPTFFVGRGSLLVGHGSPADTAVFGSPSFTFSGFHRQDGVLLAAGPRFRHDPERRTESILDIAPTIYWLFDVDLPKDLDGDVLADLVRPDSLSQRPVRVGEAAVVIPPSDVAPETEADREVLKSLGYVQ